MARTPRERTPRQVRTGGRSARVVHDVLDATIQELARIGYARFSMEAVAERAAVHRSTLYRRWPDKQQLIRDALRDAVLRHHVVPDTGSVRDDLIETLRQLVQGMSSPLGKSLMMTLQLEATDPQLLEIAKASREEREGIVRQVLQRGIERGELAANTDPALILDVLAGAMRQKLYFSEEMPKFEYLSRVIDLILDGSRRPAKRR